MDSLIHADIFFFVTTVVVVVIGVISAICLIYLVKIFKNVSDTTKTVRAEAEKIADDLGDLRFSMKERGFKLTRLFGFMSGFMRGRRAGRKSKKIINDNE